MNIKKLISFFVRLITYELIYMELELFLLLLSAHFVGDFAFQSSWMSIEKARSWEITLYHSLVYTATFVLFRIDVTLLSLIILASSHFIIEPLKPRWGIIKYIWQDQLLHIAVLIFVFLVTK